MSASQPRQPVSRAQDGSGHSFARVPVAKIERSSFDLSRNWKGTFDAGVLIPVYWKEVLPGDTVNMKTTALIRLLSPLKFPVMDDLFVDFHWWYCPNRLAWVNWVRMMGEQDNPTDSINYTVPQMTFSTTAGTIPTNGSFYDMCALPTAPMANAPASYTVNTLRFRMYNLVWNQWYRDQNHQDSVVVHTGDSGDVASDYVLLNRGKRMTDSLVSALPLPQKGAAVTLPLGISAPIVAPVGGSITFESGGIYGDIFQAPSQGMDLAILAGGGLVAPTYAGIGEGGYVTNGSPHASGVAGTNLYVDLSSATAATINSLRTSIVFQQLLEQFARGGTRYVELIRSLFGVISPDARLQRVEFVGASSTAISVFTVPQTSESATTPQAALAAYGLGTVNNKDFVHSFTEHGQLFCLMSVRAPYSYQQRIDREWVPQTRFDFYMPPMAMLGEEGILMQEVYASGLASHDTGTLFGYRERWSSYRSDFSVITGQLRSNFAQTLDFMHLAQKLDASTVLNPDFIVENPPVDRISAVSGSPDFLADIRFSTKWVRPLPIYSVPGLLRL